MNSKPTQPIRNSFELEELMRKIISDEIQKSFATQLSVNDQVLTAKEAARFLQVSIPTLNELVASKSIPYFKAGRSRRFLKSYLVQLGKASMN